MHDRRYSVTSPESTSVMATIQSPPSIRRSSGPTWYFGPNGPKVLTFPAGQAAVWVTSAPIDTPSRA